MTQATPRASAGLLAGGSSVRMTRPRHWITTSSFPPVTSGGSVISNSTGDPISRLASARMYTPAALRFPVTPLASPAESCLWIFMGNSSGNLFPVRASDTVPPLSWPCLRAKASSIRHLLTELKFALLRAGYITEGTLRKSLITAWIRVGSRFPQAGGWHGACLAIKIIGRGRTLILPRCPLTSPPFLWAGCGQTCRSSEVARVGRCVAHRREQEALTEALAVELRLRHW